MSLSTRQILSAIVEKMLAKAKLDSVDKASGLADQELEVILGQKLLQQKINKTEGKDVIVTPEVFIEQNNVNADIFYGRLNSRVKELTASKDPQAINTIIDLIPVLGEPKMIKQQKKEEVLFDLNSMNKLLGAA